MPMVGRTIEAIREAGLRDGIRIIVGGAPLNEVFAAEVGADGYAPRRQRRRSRIASTARLSAAAAERQDARNRPRSRSRRTSRRTSGRSSVDRMRGARGGLHAEPSTPGH